MFFTDKPSLDVLTKINSDSLGESLTSKSKVPEGLSSPISVVVAVAKTYW
jgi:hypothetical protein